MCGWVEGGRVGERVGGWREKLVLIGTYSVTTAVEDLEEEEGVLKTNTVN